MRRGGGDRNVRDLRVKGARKGGHKGLLRLILILTAYLKDRGREIKGEIILFSRQLDVRNVSGRKCEKRERAGALL